MKVIRRHSVQYASNAACHRVFPEGTQADFITLTKTGSAIVQWKNKLYIVDKSDFDAWDKVG